MKRIEINNFLNGYDKYLTKLSAFKWTSKIVKTNLFDSQYHYNSLCKYFKKIPFQYEIVKGLYYTIIASENEGNIVDKILKTLNIDLSYEEFLRIVENELKTLKLTETKPKISHTSMQNNQIVWLYYAFFWAWYRVENGEIKIKDVSKKIALELLRYHLKFIEYKIAEKTQEKRYGKWFFEKSTNYVVRVIEILSAMYQEDKNRFKNYLQANDLMENFLVQTGNINERDKFKRIEDIDSKAMFILYRIDSYNKIDLKSTRRLAKDDFLDSLEDDYTYYKKLVNKRFKSKDSGGGGGEKTKSFLSGNYEEDYYTGFSYELNLNDLDATEDEETEIKSNIKLLKRVESKDTDDDYFPNFREQKKINRAFSANYTKSALYLFSNYKFPDVNHLKEFIKFVSSDINLNKNTNETFFKIIFLLSLLMGYDYKYIMTIFFSKKKNKEISYKDQEILVKLDKEIFSKTKNNKFFEQSFNKISYKIPYLCNSVIAQISNKLPEKYDSLEDDYYEYIKSLTKKFDKKIVIDPKNTHILLISYRRSKMLEDMTVLHCVYKKQYADRSRLAYSSTPKESQIYSDFLNEWYKELELDSAFAKILGLKKDYFVETKLSKPIFAGSHRILDHKVSKNFFFTLKRMIKREKRLTDKFNLFTIYLRYAMSLLMGTRTFNGSDSFEKLSMNCVIISEKSNTLIDGIRAIPLCNTMQKLIFEYKRLSKKLKLDNINKPIFVKLDCNNQKNVSNFSIDCAKKVIKRQKSINYSSFNRDDFMEFLNNVPLNTGRHIISKYATEFNVNGFFVEAFLGHYIKGGEQMGIYSTMNMKNYIDKIQELTEHIAQVYGVEKIDDI